MGKYFVTVAANAKHYKVCREDIKKFYSFKLRKMPALPAYDPMELDKESDSLTNCDECEAQFEPIQFFPASSFREE